MGATVREMDIKSWLTPLYLPISNSPKEFDELQQPDDLEDPQDLNSPQNPASAGSRAVVHLSAAPVLQPPNTTINHPRGQFKGHPEANLPHTCTPTNGTTSGGGTTITQPPHLPPPTLTPRCP
jgi:hypothetical protein